MFSSPGLIVSLQRRLIALAPVLVAIFLSPTAGHARVSFDALRRDGYGMIELNRPEPNVLLAEATINGRKARLIVDTGWSGDGITVKSDFAQTLRSPVEGVKGFGHSASGQALTGFKKGIADTMTLGNVLMRQVPVYFGDIPSLRDASTRSMHADGFIGSGFLSTCSGIVDLHNLRLYLRPPGTGRRAIIGAAMKAQGLAEVPFHIIQTNCLVTVEINGAPGIMVLDTGATFAGVDERFVPQMKAKARAARARAIDAAGIERETKLTTLQSFRIAGVNVRAPDLRVGRYGFYDATHGKIIGLLGMDILGTNGTIIDFGQKKLYFYPL
ncbi:MAG TPA: aspartyl protease family protein [Chthoniobacterales bacterium]|nr:aspartyl protease family protein [Chthoniobacterales bacterium]